MNIKEFIQRASDNNALQGFDKNLVSNECKIMMIVGELGETLEADRCRARANQAVFNHSMIEAVKDKEAVMKCLFECYIKDTFEDEIADVALRIMSLVSDLNFVPEFEVLATEAINFFRWGEPRDLGEILLRITRDLVDFAGYVNSCQASPNLYRLANAFAKLTEIARHYNFDLSWHIDAKLRYNAGRPHKNGKAY